MSQALDPVALTGQVWLRPGAALPGIRSTRPNLAPRLADGRAACDIPDLLASLFSLCGHAHRFTARRALAAARGRPDDVRPDEIRTLQACTARDQVQRIAHDWPRLLPRIGAAPEGIERHGRDAPQVDTAAARSAMTSLRSNPLWRPDLGVADQLAALPAWLEHHWLGMPMAAWLRRFEADPRAWPLHWAAGANSGLACTLHAQGLLADRLATPTVPNHLLVSPEQSMPWLAQCMADEPGFCSQPHWQGAVPDTGPWNRRHDASGPSVDNATMRLSARIVEVLRLASPVGGQWLAHGALSLGPREGIAWTEMARGLLIHWVRLDGRADAPRAEAYRVLAPTEWNFHPHGVLARALATLRGPQAAADAARLAVAFDPCVEFVVQPATAAVAPQAEPRHA